MTNVILDSTTEATTTLTTTSFFRTTSIIHNTGTTNRDFGINESGH